MPLTMPMVGIVGRNDQRRLPGMGAENAHPDHTGLHTVPSVLNDIVYYQGGFIPMNLPPIPDKALVESSASLMSGLILYGGGNWHPKRSGIDLSHASVRTGMDYDERRDESELAYLEAARRWGIPVLALCRGMQGLNIDRGGKLRNIDQLTSPNLPDNHPNNHLNYDHPNGPYGHTHDIGIVHDGSDFSEVVAEAVGSQIIRGSSSAHQNAVGVLGEGLYVVGISPGDEPVIEIIADKTGLVVGVQGHPEMQRGHPYAQAVFNNFFRFVDAHQPLVAQPRSPSHDPRRFAGMTMIPPA